MNGDIQTLVQHPLPANAKYATLVAVDEEYKKCNFGTRRYTFHPSAKASRNVL